MSDLFDKFKIDWRGGQNFKNVLSKIESIEFFDLLYILFKAMVQLRNSRNAKNYDAKLLPNTAAQNADEDYIISAVKAKDGSFFDTRNFLGNSRAPLPQDADANGAYNIALKSLLLLERLDKAENLQDAKFLTISNKDWFEYRQRR